MGEAPGHDAALANRDRSLYVLSIARRPHRAKEGTMFARKLDREGAIILAFGWLVALAVTLT
jgi:hypothetical protein